MRVLLTGAGGSLGPFVMDQLLQNGHTPIAWSRSLSPRPDVQIARVDLADESATLSALQSAAPEAVLHLAAISATEQARQNPALAAAINIEATRTLAAWCRQHDTPLLYTSTDMVFDGRLPWRSETDTPAPATIYGQTKLAAEPHVLATPRGLVVRLPLLYGLTHCPRPTFCDRAIAALASGQPQPFFTDEYRTPLSYPDAARALVHILTANSTTGLLHLAGRDRLSRFELMRRLAQSLNLDPSLVQPARLTSVPFPEPRPADVSLDTTRLQSLFPHLPRTPPDLYQAP